MTAATGLDAYFALRYRENTDVINFSPLERFAMESWTANVFSRERNLTLQLVATGFIFSELYGGLVGMADGHHFCFAPVLFALLRLVQFLFREIPAVNMI